MCKEIKSNNPPLTFWGNVLITQEFAVWATWWRAKGSKCRLYSKGNVAAMPRGVVVVGFSPAHQKQRRVFVPSDCLIFTRKENIFSLLLSISSKVSGRWLTSSGRGDAAAVTPSDDGITPRKKSSKISDRLTFRASGVSYISVLNRRETEAVVNKISNSKSKQGHCIEKVSPAGGRRGGQSTGGITWATQLCSNWHYSWIAAGSQTGNGYSLREWQKPVR